MSDFEMKAFVFFGVVWIASFAVVACKTDANVDPRTTAGAPETNSFVQVLEQKESDYEIFNGRVVYRKLCVEGTVVYTARIGDGQSVLRRGGSCSTK
jgi:hypothetical protein